MVKPTPEEARNGWTEESLTKYQQERAQAQAAVIRNDVIDAKRGLRARGNPHPLTANGKYRPQRWRG